jgi:hypothetical protein
MKINDLDESWGRRSSFYNPMDQERREQDAADWAKRDFKRREMEHELGHEDDPNFERNLRQQQIDRDRGPWYLKINGKILTSKGQPKSFDWKRGANNYALAIIKNKPELQGKIFLTKRAGDDTISENATAGATSAANVGTVVNPHHSPGKARGKKSYLGSPGTGSGTKAPPQPKVVQPKTKAGTAVNGLDIKGSSLFGGPAKAAGVIKRR